MDKDVVSARALRAGAEDNILSMTVGQPKVYQKDSRAIVRDSSLSRARDSFSFGCYAGTVLSIHGAIDKKESRGPMKDSVPAS